MIHGDGGTSDLNPIWSTPILQKFVLTTAMSALTQTETARDTAQNVATTAAAIGAGIATRSLITKAWEASTGEAPPNDPTAPDVTWKQALTWAAATGVGVGVGRVVGRRFAAKAFGKDADGEKND